MRWACYARNVILFLVTVASLALLPMAPRHAKGQDKAEQPPTKDVRSAREGDPIQAIDDEYNRQVLELGRRRLEQLGRLAAGQKPAAAAATYERLFRLAIADDLFRDAEPAAAKVVEQGTPSATTNALAHLVKIIAEADRGAFEQSLQSLRQAVSREYGRTAGDRQLGQPWPPARSSESARPTISAWSKQISSRSPVRRSGSCSKSHIVPPSKTSLRAA